MVIEKASELSDRIVIVGDLNVNFLNLPNTHVVNEIILKYSFFNTIHEATRITQHTNTLLDPVLVSGFSQCDVLDSGTIDIEHSLSDHKGTYIYLKFISNHMLYKTNRTSVKHGYTKMQTLTYTKHRLEYASQQRK